MVHRAKYATPKQNTASIMAALDGAICAGVSLVKAKVRGTRDPLAKLGTVVATVARRLVPNYSAAMVTKTAQ